MNKIILMLLSIFINCGNNELSNNKYKADGNSRKRPADLSEDWQSMICMSVSEDGREAKKALENIKFYLKDGEYVQSLANISFHKSKMTLLQYAIFKKAFKTASLMLKKMTPISIVNVNEKGNNALHNVACYGDESDDALELLDELLSYETYSVQNPGALKKLPFDAQSNGQSDQDKKLNINSKNIEGDTPLMFAATTGKKRVVEKLISKDADFIVSNNNGHTALSLSVAHGDVDIFKILLEKNVEIDEYYIYQLMQIAIKKDKKEIFYILFNIKELSDDLKQDLLYFTAEKNKSDILKFLIDTYGDNVDLDCIHTNRKGHKNNLLSLSVENNNLYITGYLLEKGAKNIIIAINLAIQNKYSDFTSLLINGIEKEELFSQKHNNGNNLITLAIVSNNKSALKMLLKKGIDYSEKNNEGYSPIHYLASESIEDSDMNEMLDYLLEAGADIDTADDNNSNTILHIAVINQLPNITKYLLGKGADISITNSRGLTPLHLSVFYGNIDIFKMILEKSHEINEEYLFELTSQAIKFERLDILEILLDIQGLSNHDKHNLLYYAVYRNENNIFKMVIDKYVGSVDLDHIYTNCKDIDEDDLLSLSLRNNNIDITKILLEKGAINIDRALLLAISRNLSEFSSLFINNFDLQTISSVKDSSGRTAITYAVTSNSELILRQLLEKGVDSNIADNEGKTPLYYAIDYLKISAIKMLIDNNSSIVNKPFVDGKTYLHQAIERVLVNSSDENIIILEKILNSPFYKDNDNLELTNSNGETALYTAVRYSFATSNYTLLINIVNLLIEVGANLDALNKDGKNILHLACEHNRDELVKYFSDNHKEFVKKYLNIPCESDGNNTPLHIAVINGNKEILKILLQNNPDYIIKNGDNKTALKLFGSENLTEDQKQCFFLLKKHIESK